MNEKELSPVGSPALPLPEPVETPSLEDGQLPDQETDASTSAGVPAAPSDVVEVSGGDPTPSPGGVGVFVSGGDVSASDLSPVDSGGVPVADGRAGGVDGSKDVLLVSGLVDSLDYSPWLEDVGAKLDTCVTLLSLLVALAAFYWCHARIRNAVRSFTGRNAIDE